MTEKEKVEKVKKIRKKPSKHPLTQAYENQIKKLETHKQKLTKLTDSYAGGEVTKEAYDTLKNDYENKIAESKESISEIQKNINHERKILDTEERAIEKEFELIKAKKIVGDISDSHYEKIRQEFETRLSEIRDKKSRLSV